MSSTNGSGAGRVKVEVTVYAPCKKHTQVVFDEGRKRLFWREHVPRTIPMSTQFCGCPPVIERQTVDEHDLQTSQWAQLVMAGLLATSTSTIKDTSGNTHTVSAGFTAGTVQIVAGTGTTAAAVSDYELGTAVTGTSGYIGSPTIGSLTETGTSGSFTITGTITNSSASLITYSEIGVVVTIATYIYLILHDVTSSPYWPVSVGGTLAVTYTVTNA